MIAFPFRLNDRVVADDKNDTDVLARLDEALHQIGGRPEPERPRTQATVIEELRAYQRQRGLLPDGAAGLGLDNEPARRTEGPTALSINADLRAQGLARQGRFAPDHRTTVPMGGGIGPGQPNRPEDILRARRVFGLMGTFPRHEALIRPLPARAGEEPDLWRAIAGFQRQYGLSVDAVMKPGGETQRRAGPLVEAKVAMEVGDDFARPQPFKARPNPTIVRNHPDTPTRMSVPFGSGMGMDDDDTDHRLASAHAAEIVEAASRREVEREPDRALEINSGSEGTENTAIGRRNRRKEQTTASESSTEDQLDLDGIEVVQPLRGLSIDETVEDFLGINLDMPRGQILPVGRDESGKTVFAYPEWALALVKAGLLPSHVMQGGRYDETDTADFALSAAGGGLLAKRPKRSVGSGGRPAANLSENLKRARKQGYSSESFYHGDRDGKLRNEYPAGTFFSRDKNYSDGVAWQGGGTRAREFRLRFTKPLDMVDVLSVREVGEIVESIVRLDGREAAEAFVGGLPTSPQLSLSQFRRFAAHDPDRRLISGAHLEQALSVTWPGNGHWKIYSEAGYDAIDTGRDLIMLRPSGIRLKDAEFDPAKIESRNIHSRGPSEEQTG